MSHHSSSLVEKLVAGLALAFALIVMASIFTPSPSSAENGREPSHNQHDPHSTNPHEGLASLGSLEGKRYVIHAWATDRGPRYSIYDAVTDEELSVLITAERVAEWYPEVDLPAIDFDTPSQIMLAEPDHEILPR